MELNEKSLKKLKTELRKCWYGNKDGLLARPTLGSLHWHENGNIEFTNSHIAVRMIGVHNEGEKHEPKLPNGSIYPDLHRIFESCQKGSFKTILNTKEMMSILSPFKVAKSETIKLTFTANSITFEPLDGSVINSATLTVKEDISENLIIACKTNYLLNAMMFFHSQGIKQVKMVASSPVRPMLIVHDNIEYIITPVRIGA